MMSVFPAPDPLRNDPVEMGRIFQNIYGVKRVRPGTPTELSVRSNNNIVQHDYSAPGGNSGSCVVDRETSKVIGLHFSGRY